MKRILVIFIAMISMMIIVPSVSYAQDKATLKEIKKKLKEFKKEGWKIYGSTSTLETALTNHKKKTNGGGYYEVQGAASVTDSKHKNVLHQAAQANACASYAGECRKVIGQTVSEMALASEEAAEFERFAATYQTKVEKEIKGELRESFAIIKEVSANQLDMQVFYTVKDNAALKSLENAAKESEVVRKYIKQISVSLEEHFKSK